MYALEWNMVSIEGKDMQELWWVEGGTNLCKRMCIRRKGRGNQIGSVKLLPTGTRKKERMEKVLVEGNEVSSLQRNIDGSDDQ